MNLEFAVALCVEFEGFRSKPYLCPAGVPTIGFGSTYYENGTKVTIADPPVTKDQAAALLMHELTKVCVPGVRRQCPQLYANALTTGNWRPFNAIVDFTYNLGVGALQTSTLRKKVNEQDWEGAKTQLLRWVRGGGKVLPGLVRRRNAEAALL